MKNIVLCADGTWNTPHGIDASAQDTNVRKLYCALENDPAQLKYYDSGVGTDGTPLDHLIGGAMGEGLFQKVQDCYAFLSYVYDPGDRIYLFGFSRGAYTARSVAGMIAAFGVPNINMDNETVGNIFAAYREPDPAKKAQLKDGLTKQYGLMPVTIAMVGVWDTVGSLGIPGIFFNMLNQKRYGFLDTALSSCVERAYHAVSIDERRAQFEPTLWTHPDGSYRANDATVEQVWFPGVHSDVGGGYPDSSLADITLSWMMHKAKENGLLFSDESQSRYFSLAETCAAGQAHDEWKLIPWGLPNHRSVPSNASLANSVLLRITGASVYKPENLTWNGAAPAAYPVTPVLPYPSSR